MKNWKNGAGENPFSCTYVRRGFGKKRFMPHMRVNNGHKYNQLDFEHCTINGNCVYERENWNIKNIWI